MKQFIEKVRQDYDIVLIDAPPVGTVTDAAILSTIVDGTMLVTASGQVEIEAAQRAKELLEKVKANIIGVVLNKLSKNAQGNYYYYYYYYYGEDEDKAKKKRKKPRKENRDGR
ncbi:MAG: capsular polysaccharide biosynthesis protein Cap1B [Clostridia bacterium]|nr:capsular polysaccharide biosynthesis protein Cap1B [Clostridia bacterium]